MNRLKRSDVAWRFNALQLIFGILGALIIGGSAIMAVLVFAVCQAGFTMMAFKDAGAKQRQQVFRNFVIGEVLKLLLLIGLSLLLVRTVNLDFITYIYGLVVMQVAALIVPLVCNKLL